MALAEASIGTRRWYPSDTPGCGVPAYGAGPPAGRSFADPNAVRLVQQR